MHVTYFTTVVGEGGQLSSYGDVYGYDSRMSAALGGKPLGLKSSPAATTSSPPTAAPAAAEAAGLLLRPVRELSESGRAHQPWFEKLTTGLAGAYAHAPLQP